MNVQETSVIDITRFNFDGSLVHVRAKLGKLLGDGEYFNKALPILARLEEVIHLLKRMNV